MNKLLLCIFSILVFSIANSFGQTNTNIFPLTGPVGIGTLTPSLDFQLSLFDPIITNRDYRKSGISLTLEGTSEIDENSHLVLLGKDCSIFNELTRLTLPSDMYSALILHSGRGKLGDIIVTNRNEDGAIRFATTPPPPPPTPEVPEPPVLDYERMRINNIGNVGIANQDPKELLHIGDKMTFHIGYENNYIANNVYTDAVSGSTTGATVYKTCEKGYPSMISMSNQRQGVLTIGVAGLLDENEEVSFEEKYDNFKGISIFHHDATVESTKGYAQVTIGNIWPLAPNARFSVRSIGTNKDTYAMFVQNAESKELFVVNDAGMVGIGNKKPQAALHVGGSSIIEGSTSVWGSLSANGNLTISGTGSINGNTTIGGTLSVAKIISPTQKLQLDGNVQIGDLYSNVPLAAGLNHKLSVDGLIIAKEMRVTLDSWADYVFNDNYSLRTIDELENFININKHLPEIPSEIEVRENGGIEIGDMQIRLLRKIEELTLYVIELKKENQKIKEILETK